MNNEELVSLIQAGINPRDNMAELYQLNRGFIWKQSVKYQGMLEMDDIMQEAYFILDKAVKTYDPNRGLFISWLGHCISYDMPRNLSALCDIHIPSYMAEKMYMLKRFVDEFNHDTGRDPSDREIIDSLGLSEKQLKNIRNAEKLLVKKSLSDPVDDDIILEETISDDRNLYELIEETLDNETYSAILTDALSELTENQRNVIRLRMNGSTFGEVCSTLGMKHTQQAQQAEKAGIKNLRRNLNQSPMLKMLYEDAYHGSLTNFKTTFTSIPERIVIHHLT